MVRFSCRSCGPVDAGDVSRRNGTLPQNIYAGAPVPFFNVSTSGK